MKKRIVLKQPRTYEANARQWRGVDISPSGRVGGGGG
jgi:hypothetical protein